MQCEQPPKKEREDGAPLLTSEHRTDPTIRLNLEDVKSLDEAMVEGYEEWVEKAPSKWQADGLFKYNAPIVLTSRFGQDTAIAIPDNEEEEGDSWQKERDFSKVAFLTFALATSIA